MSSPLRDLFSGLIPPRRALTELVTPRRTFEDVVLPPSTYRQLDHALAQIRHHDLIFQQWGLGERHDTGLGLAFNFAGPPGTGKTICAEAIAHALGKRLLVVRYAEMESMWVGETGKNVAAVFRLAAEHDAVLFFDEADAIASRRFTSFQQGAQREMNTVVNVLLRELDGFAGVVVFATNLAVNFDPAFERRIRTHILFELPGVDERERIWRVQVHPRKTPLAADVDFRMLAERFETAGGDIKNAVLKAAQMAASEDPAGDTLRIRQDHLLEGMQEVLHAKRVMEQSLFSGEEGALAAMGGAAGGAGSLVTRQESIEDDVSTLAARLVEVEDEAIAARQEIVRLASSAGTIEDGVDEMRSSLESLRSGLVEMVRESGAQHDDRIRTATRIGGAALLAAMLALFAIALVLLGVAG